MGVPMKLHASGEDYLETILVLQKKLGMVPVSYTHLAHGMSEIWFFKDAFLATGVSEQQVQVQTQYYTDPKYVLLSLAVTAIPVSYTHLRYG